MTQFLTRLRAKRVQRFAAFSTALALGLSTASSEGALYSNSAMDSMWNYTSATTTFGRMGATLSGGNGALRVPVRNYTLYSFDPPRVDAGCGGVDLYLGSFSFLGTDQFKQMVRQIVQAAPGYLIHLAITAVCNPCSNILTWLQNMAREMNSGQYNTCKLSKMMVGSAIGASGLADAFGSNFSNEINLQWGEAKGLYNGFVSAWDKMFSSGPLQATSQARDSSTNNANMLVNALVTNGGIDMMENGMFGGPAALVYNFMSFFGTTLRRTTDPGNQTLSYSDEDFPATLTFADLVEGKAPGSVEPKKLNSCSDLNITDPHSCQSLSKNEKYLWFGTKRYVITMLAGDQTTSDALSDNTVVSSYQTDSILDKIVRGVNLSGQEISFLRAFPRHELVLLLDVMESSPSDPAAINGIVSVMAEDYATYIGRAMLRTLHDTYAQKTVDPNAGGSSSKVTGAMPDHIKEAAKKFRADLEASVGVNAEARTQKVMVLRGLIAQQRQLKMGQAF
ncbi:conjugal transfer protein TraH [Cupriavidus malaysiensis]|uniref:Conjugal transfer protein TraH n=1 Tax=Cupriavidus malaysiensis TaxID=367825 RepID=A0ABN4U0M6_9BURK|nr:conjugal transfer protein TraH [Cupriavidus malaysiensis]AOZ11211.1 hypothetical protein BKK80_35245 [Cupriavidus malaysiensis]